MIQLMSLVGPCIGALSGVGIGATIFNFNDKRVCRLLESNKMEYSLYKSELSIVEASILCRLYQDECYILENDNKFKDQYLKEYPYSWYIELRSMKPLLKFNYSTIDFSQIDPKIKFNVYLEKSLCERINLDDRISKIERRMTKKKKGR